MAERNRKDKPTQSADTQNAPEANAQTPAPETGDAKAQAPPTQQEARDAASPVGQSDAQSAQAQGEQAPSVVGVFEVAVLPLQQTTLFPSTVVPLSAGRPRSIAAVEASLSTEEKLLAGITVREGRGGPEGEATPPDLYNVGTLVTVKRMMRTMEGLQLIVHGVERIRVVEWTQTDPHLRAQVHALPAPIKRDDETVEALMRNLQSLVQRALAMLPEIPPEIRGSILSTNDPVQLAYFLGSILNLGVEQEQQMLEADYVDDLLQIAYARMAREIEIMELRSKIATEAQSEMTKAQRDYVLRQQMSAIQKELGEDDEGGERAEADMLRERMGQADLPEDVHKEAERELRRMERLPQAAPDYNVIRTWLEVVLELPWKISSDDKLDLNEARRVLDEDHYGLEEVKERILEFLAVVKLRRDSKSPILCFVGPPGVGKTSLGMSIARALGSPVRASLSGRRARRSGTARPPTHIHRRDAGPNHPIASTRGRQQSRDDARRD